MSMAKKIITVISIMLAVLLIAPLAVLNFANPMDGMGLMFLLFFVVNPSAAVVVGVLAGGAVKRMWWSPPLFAAMFLPCCWLALQEVVLDLMPYAVAYLLLGAIAMVVVNAFCRQKR